MGLFDHEIDIEAPIEYVFDWSTLSENWERSMPALVDRELIEETDDGARYHNTFKLLGRTTTSIERYTVDAENYRTTSVFEDENMSGKMVFDYIEAETGTHLRVHGDFETGSSLFERPLRPVVTRYMFRQFRTTMTTMKKLIETEYLRDGEPVEAEA